MKTSVNMIRKLDIFDVVQRTKDGMFNATVLLQQWNEASGQQKQMIHYFDLKQTKEFITALEKDEDLKNGITFFKSRGKYNGGTWMHPLLFIDFAMWLNPAFKVKVLKFVYDELIKDRHLAGDNYRLLSASISKFPDVNYPEVARALNWIIFNKHHSEIRNTATTDQIKELHELEQKLAYAIDMNLINSYPQLIQVLRDTYNKKHPRF